MFYIFVPKLKKQNNHTCNKHKFYTKANKIKDQTLFGKKIKSRKYFSLYLRNKSDKT